MKQFFTFYLCLTLLGVNQTMATDRDVYSGQSIQTAINASGSGDRVLIHVGTYNESLSVLNKSNLTITSAGDGTAIIQGNGTNDETIYVLNPTNIVISNLTVKNQRKQIWVKGIYVDGAGSGIQILNNIITEVSYKSGTWSAADNPGSVSDRNANPLVIVGANTSTALTNVLVSGNQVSYCTTGWSESITIKGNVNGFVVENNTVHHVTNIAMDAYGLGDWPNAAQARNGVFNKNIVYNAICNYTDNGGIYVDGGKDIVISNNTIYNSVYGITIGCENQGQVSGGNTSGIKVINNLVYNNSKAAIMIGTGGDDDGLQGDVVNSLVSGNTFLKNSTSDQWGGEIVLQNSTGITFYNNIVYGLWQQMIGEGPGKGTNIFGYNIFYNPVGSPLIGQAINNWNTINFATWKGQNSDNTSVYTDPLITSTSATSPNVHLLSNSPAINAGNPNFTPISGEIDIDGQARIQNSRVDIGVDESGSGGTIAVTGVSVSPTSATKTVGQTQQLTKTITPSNATNQNVTWSSSNTSVATVSSSGLVTAVAAGSATITVTTVDGGKTAICTITVTSANIAVTSVTVSPTSATKTVGQTQQLTKTITPSNATNQNVTWSSSNTSVATVNTSGLVTAVTAGTATITVTTVDGGKTANSIITVTASNIAVTSVSVSPTSATKTVGQTQQLTKTITPSNATNQNVTWSSSNTSVATVNSSGLVTAIAAGSATITVTTVDGGKTANSTMTVTSGGAPNITVDGSLSDWSGISALATATGQSALSMKVYDDGTYLYFGISGSGLGAHYQIYLNTDNNTSTGYNHFSFSGNTGADYYIEDGNVSSYTGNGTSWSWSSPVGTATQSISGTTVREIKVAKSLFGSLNSTITLAFVDINSSWTLVSKLGYSSFVVQSSGGSTITIDGSLSDWSSISTIATSTGQSALSLKAYDDGTYLYFALSGSGLGSNYQVYLNKDNNTSTGYNHFSFTGSTGADYYIENGSVSSYTGDGSSWSWSAPVGTATASKSGTVCELKVAKSLFGTINSQIKVAYVDINSSWSVVSKLGFSAYNLQSGARMGNSAFEQEGIQSGEQQISVFPNPYTEVINVALGDSGDDVKIVIYDMLGRVVYHKVTTESQERISASQLHLEGIGILTIQKQGHIYQYKIIK